MPFLISLNNYQYFMNRIKVLFSMAVALVISSNLSAQNIILPDLLRVDIVLQQQTDARIWGKAKPGSAITVSTSWNGRKYKVTAPSDSLWSVKVATPQASYTQYEVVIASGKEKIVLDNVLIGDVWFCGGQSNMEMPLKGMFNCSVDNAAEEILHSAQNKGLRYVTIKKNQSLEPIPGYFTEGRWNKSGPASAADFSATGYFFGQALRQALDIPIGLISCNWSGSFVEDWMSKELIEKYPDQEVFGVDFSKAFTKMYYGMLEPASRYTIKGMIWYQGESNVGSPNYAERLAAAVELWKSKFELERMPFYIVEIAPYNYNKGYEMMSADLRGQQLKASRLIPDSGLVCTNDLVYDYEADQIHPAQKKAVGERLALLAISKTYGMGNPCEGPVFKEMTISGDAAYIQFDNAVNGFVNQGGLRGFEIAGEDHVFYPATAVVGFAPRKPGVPRMMGMGGFAIKVTSDKVSAPVAVRYGYGPFVPGNLRNTEGLGAYPFRTDDWPLR